MSLEASPAELSRRALPLPITPSVLTDENAEPERIALVLTINAREHKFRDVPANQLLVDFLHEQEELRLTGTKLNCAIGACGACKVAVQETPDGPYLPVLGCFARMNALAGMRITTVEHLSILAEKSEDEDSCGQPLHPLQREFLRQFAFQCGYCTPGFLMAAFVLMESLRRRPIPKAQLDTAIYQAFAGQLCRCTGYARYINATRDVILKAGGLVLDDDTTAPEPKPFGVCFRIVKRSNNDLADKPLIGYFDQPNGEVTFGSVPSIDTCRAWIDIPVASVRTGEPIRDLNLRRFFFITKDLANATVPAFRFTMGDVHLIDDHIPAGLVPGSSPIPLRVAGNLCFGSASLPITSELLVRVLSGDRLHIITRNPIELDMRDLRLPLSAFALEFGLKLLPKVEVSLDVILPYRAA